MKTVLLLFLYVVVQAVRFDSYGLFLLFDFTNYICLAHIYYPDQILT